MKDFSYAPVALSGDVHLVPKTYLLLQFASNREHIDTIKIFFMSKDLAALLVLR